MPSWNTFQPILHKTHVTRADVGYLSPVTAPSTYMNVTYAVIQRTLHIMNELNLDYLFINHKIFMAMRFIPKR